MGHETRRPITLPDPRCGRALYFAFEGADPQQVEVTYEDGVHVAIFRDLAESDDATRPGELVVPIDDMAGRFECIENA